MILLPFEEFETWVQDIADSRSPELRMGQVIYNLLYMSFPEQVELPGICLSAIPSPIMADPIGLPSLPA